MKKRNRLPFEMTKKQKKHIKEYNLFSIKAYKQASVKPEFIERQFIDPFDWR